MSGLIFNGRFHYIPIPLGKKAPVHIGWNNKENCITKAQDTNRLKGMNIGLATSYSRVVHLDIDNFILARDWLQQEHKICLKEILLGAESVFCSGRQGSISALFMVPDDMNSLESAIIHTNRHVAFEFRCANANGKTGNSLIPPSTHPDGTSYRWLKGNLSTIGKLPFELKEVWVATQNSRHSPQDVVRNSHLKKLLNNKARDCQQETPRKKALLLHQLQHIDPHCNYDIWRNVVWGILSTGWDSAESIAREWSLGAPTLFDEKLFSNFVEYFEFGHISVGTIWHYARQGGWDG